MKIYRRANTPYYWVDHTFLDGSRVRHSLKTTDKMIARIRAKELITKIEQGKTFFAKKGSFFAEYLAYANPRKSPRTVKTERQMWRQFTDFLKSDNPNDATQHTIEQFFTQLLNQKRKDSAGNERPKDRPATINSYHRVLRHMFNKAVQWKFAFVNPLQHIEMMRFEPEPPRYLTKSEIDKFFLKAKQLRPDLLPLFLFYFLTGLRRSEAFNLRWEDVDFDRQLLTVRKTKGKRPRFVPITPLAEKILRQRQDLPSPFSSDINKELSSNPGPIQRIVTAAGLSDITLHDLRRSFATYMAPHINKTLLQQLIGHEDYSVTDVFYIGTNSKLLRKKMMVLDDMLKNVGLN
jgi:integrase